MRTSFTEKEILDKIEYFKENINAIECFLLAGKIDLDDIMLYVLYLGIPLESVNEDFNKFNNDEFKKITRYACMSEKIEAIYKILCRVQNKINIDIANNDYHKETLYVYNTSLCAIDSIKKHLEIEINEINDELKNQHKEPNKILSKNKK